MRRAYAMVLDPGSVWYRDGGGGGLVGGLVGGGESGRVSVHTKATWLGVGVVLGALVALWGLGETVVRKGWEGVLGVVLPEVYEVMVEREGEEGRRRAAGLEVDTDPQRLQPRKLQRINFPGRFLDELD